ncbi:hypothetical protein HK100_001592 [Physocladia obscura]|uniref:peptidylprolyl isomerase n=1 Tax=Physocladia obscura TaxID=109957 RepID=A0AAD5XK68_9FUNG|nr:hypothetical protein HK100_001592 [Physocladia obscura]
MHHSASVSTSTRIGISNPTSASSFDQRRNLRPANPYAEINNQNDPDYTQRTRVPRYPPHHEPKPVQQVNSSKKSRKTFIVTAVIVAVVAVAAIVAGVVVFVVHPGQSSASSLVSSSTAPLSSVTANNTATSASSSTNSSLIIIDSNVSKLIITPGDGVTFPKTNDTVHVNYIGMFVNGTIFDENTSQSSPFSTKIGVGRVIPGWDIGVPTMSLKEVSILYIKSVDAYGEAGAPPLIPPNTDLNFKVTLLGIN